MQTIIDHSVHITNHTEIFDHARNMVNASVVTLVDHYYVSKKL